MKITVNHPEKAESQKELKEKTAAAHARAAATYIQGLRYPKEDKNRLIKTLISLAK